MGSRDCPYPVPGDAWFEKKKKDKTLIWIPRPLPEQWSQTLVGLGPGICISYSPPRHPKVQSVSITLGRGGGRLPLPLAPLLC